jgi:outer membrane receptor protein involved in Fe transport
MLRSACAILALFTTLALPFAAAPAVAQTAGSADRSGDLGEIVVTAGLREQAAATVPASLTVLDAATLAGAGQQHFEDVLGLVPNLAWSGGSARPRYLQLRGIGELEQYEGAPNPSIGFLVDDIDFSGLGTVATLYDLDRIEVLRGPQGTRYGANALGGLVYVRSRAPSPTFDAGVTGTVANLDTRSLGAMLTGPAPSLDSSWRLAVQQHRSDGPYRNVYLDRATSARDELTARGRWRYAPSEAVSVDLAVLHARLDDGYDAFTIDNSRRMQSDRPGEDSQRATGASVRAEWRDGAGGLLTLLATAAESDSTHAYDGDWGNPALWAPYTYDFTYRALRDRSTRTLEARYASGDAAPVEWLVGAYAQQLRETIDETSGGVLAGPADDPVYGVPFVADDALASRYRARSYAVFGQLDGDLRPDLRWSLGLRGERRDARYGDARTSSGAPAGDASFAPDDSMAGGHASLTWTYAADRRAYVQVSRGYKAGGFNPSGALPDARRLYGPETLWNAELGWKARLAGGRVRVEAAAFQMWREKLQIRTGAQLVPGDPNTFVFYTGNAARGYNRGLEGSLRWLATRRVELGASLGVLRTQYRDFAIDGVAVPNREQPHAPRWQAAVDATWRGDGGWYARADLTGTGGFYFDVPPNDTRTGGYVLAHLRGGWEGPRWSAAAYVRNVADRDYPVRGFYFGNEPPDFPSRLYTQLGAPREWGVTLEYRYR